jgi:hypothetical protein
VSAKLTWLLKKSSSLFSQSGIEAFMSRDADKGKPGIEEVDRV